MANLMRGDQFQIWVYTGTTSANTEIIAYGTSCSLNVESETVTASSKYSCRWNEATAGNASWTVNSDSLYCDTGATFEELMEMMLDGDPVGVIIGQESGHTGSCETNPHRLDTAKPYFVGKAIPTSLTLEASTNEFATVSATFTGSGALEQKG